MKFLKYGALGALLLIVVLNKLYWQEDEVSTEEIATINCYNLEEGCYISTSKIKFKITSNKPIMAMQQFILNVEVLDNKNYQPIKVSYNMKEMDMGINEYPFVKANNKKWDSVALIPFCISGLSNWVATITFKDESQKNITINANFNVLQK